MQDIKLNVTYPAAHLGALVESFWMLANTADESRDIVVLPDGRVDIIFAHSAAEPFHAFVAGVADEPSATTLAPRSLLCAVSFKPLAVEYILHSSVADILNQVAMLPSDYWGIQKSDMEDFDVFCTKLNEKIEQRLSKNIDNKKLKMFDLIYANKGSLGVKELADEVHWSSRQINRYFNQWLGLSLKAYSGVLRFRSTFPQIKAGKLFPESDFSDQAHFIKEIKRYSGVTPKTLRTNKDDRFIQFSSLS